MSMLERYKKKGGFFQLLQIIETVHSKKREQFLSIVANESHLWEEAIQQKMLSVELIFNWKPEFLVEILTRLPTLTLASVMHGKTNEEIEKILGCMPLFSKKKILDRMAEIDPTNGEKLTSESKIISEVRDMILNGIIKLEKINPALIIEENMEELLINKSKDLEDKIKVIEEPKEPKVNPLQIKINLLTTELNEVKEENLLLKSKLAQIKKIA